VIRFTNVTKKFGDHYALKNISLSIDKGEFVFITGPSGAGKTSILKMIYGSEQADDGEVMVSSWDVSKLGARSLPFFRRSIGIVFQDFKLLSRKSIFENVALPMRVTGTPYRDISTKVPQLLKLVGLAHKAECTPSQLSGGEQQRVVIARALANEPAVLIADEPTGNLDYDLSLEIIQLLKDICARGTTVVMATHNREIVRQTGRRVIRLEKGEVASEGTSYYGR